MNNQNQFNGGCGTMTAATKSQSVLGDTPTNSRIRDGVAYLEAQMSELHSIISSVEARLDTVLVPSPPQAASVNQDKRGSNGPLPSHLFERMGSLSHTAAEAQNRLRAILSRIEV